RLLSGAKPTLRLADGTAIRRGALAARWHAGGKGPRRGHRGPEGRRPHGRGAPANAWIQPGHAPTSKARASPRPPPGDPDPRRTSLWGGPLGPRPHPPDDLRLRPRRRARAHVVARPLRDRADHAQHRPHSPRTVARGRQPTRDTLPQRRTH